MLAYRLRLEAHVFGGLDVGGMTGAALLGRFGATPHAPEQQKAEDFLPCKANVASKLALAKQTESTAERKRTEPSA